MTDKRKLFPKGCVAQLPLEPANEEALALVSKKSNRSFLFRPLLFAPSQLSVSTGLAVASVAFVVLDRTATAATTAANTAGHAIVEVAALGAGVAAGAGAARAVRIAGNTAAAASGTALAYSSSIGSLVSAAALGFAAFLAVSSIEVVATNAPLVCAAASQAPRVIQATMRAAPEIAQRVRSALKKRTEGAEPDAEWTVVDDST